MQKRLLLEAISKYCSSGILKGSSLLLTPDEAIRFAEDLSAIDVKILGLDGWRYVDKSQGTIVQDLTTDISVDEMILSKADAAKECCKIVVDFIINELSTEVDFVSFTLDVRISRDLLHKV